MEDVRSELLKQKAEATRKLEKLAGLPDGRKLPDGSVLVLRIRYRGVDKIWTYLALKAGGKWFFTGRGPHAAGWGAVERWLVDNDRFIVSVTSGRVRGPGVVGLDDLTVTADWTENLTHYPEEY